MMKGRFSGSNTQWMGGFVMLTMAPLSLKVHEEMMDLPGSCTPICAFVLL